MVFNGKQEIRIHYSCEGEIEKSAPRDQRLASRDLPSLIVTNRDPWDGCFDPILTLIIYSLISYLFY